MDWALFDKIFNNIFQIWMIWAVIKLHHRMDAFEDGTFTGDLVISKDDIEVFRQNGVDLTVKPGS